MAKDSGGSIRNSVVSENNDGTCIFCEGHFSDDLRREMPKYCELQAHYGCAGEEGEYNFWDFYG